MSSKYSIISALVFGLLISSVAASASAAATSKQQLKQPAVTSTVLAAIQTTERNKKSLDGALAYRPTHWKPTSYMGVTHHHCRNHSRNYRSNSSWWIG